MRSIRRIRNLSQNDFAARLGYSKSYIEKLEQGSKPITKEVCESIDKMFNLEKNYREACCKYATMYEQLNRPQKGKFHKLGFFCLIIIIFILVFIF